MASTANTRKKMQNTFDYKYVLCVLFWLLLLETLSVEKSIIIIFFNQIIICTKQNSTQKDFSISLQISCLVLLVCKQHRITFVFVLFDHAIST